MPESVSTTLLVNIVAVTVYGISGVSLGDEA